MKKKKKQLEIASLQLRTCIEENGAEGFALKKNEVFDHLLDAVSLTQVNKKKVTVSVTKRIEKKVSLAIQEYKQSLLEPEDTISKERCAKVQNVIKLIDFFLSIAQKRNLNGMNGLPCLDMSKLNTKWQRS